MELKKNWTSLADLTVAVKDGVTVHQWAIRNKPRAGQPKGPAVDPRAGTTLVAEYDGEVALTPGAYSVRFGMRDDGTCKVWGVTPCDTRAKMRFLGFPTTMDALRDGEGDPNPVVEGAFGRYIMADFAIDDPKNSFNGLTFRAFLNIEAHDLTKSNRGVVTRSFVRKALGLPASADLLPVLKDMQTAGAAGSEWVKLNDIALKTVHGLSGKLDSTGKLVELADTDDLAAARAKLQAELAALEV